MISPIVNDLQARYDYYEINEKFIYFKDCVTGKGYYDLVVLGGILDNNTPVTTNSKY